MLENVPAPHNLSSFQKMFLLQFYDTWQTCEHVVKHDCFDILQKSNEKGSQEEINLIMKEDIIRFGNKTTT